MPLVQFGSYRAPIPVRGVTRYVPYFYPSRITYTPARAIVVQYPFPAPVEPPRVSRLRWYLYDPSVLYYVGSYPVLVEGGLRVVYLTNEQAARWRDAFVIGLDPYASLSWTRRKVISQFSGNRIAANLPPVVTTPLVNQSATEDTPFSYQFGANAFTDPDNASGAFLAYKARQVSGAALPSWLHFNPLTRTFSGTPPDPSAGTISIRVTASDKWGRTVTDDFDLVIAAD